MITFQSGKTAITIILSIIGSWVVLGYYQHKAGQEIINLKSQNEALKEESQKAKVEIEAWKSKTTLAELRAAAFQSNANAAVKAAETSQAKVAALQKKLDALPKPKPPQDPSELPKDQEHLLGAFQEEGFQPFPIAEPKAIAFGLDNSRQLLALVRDGRSYPYALARESILKEQIGNLESSNNSKDLAITSLNLARQEDKQAIQSLNSALDVSEKTTTNYQKALQNTEKQLDLSEKRLQAEKPKKWIAAVGGLLLGLCFLL